MNVVPAESEPDEPPPRTMRFMYPSGSRPLEGYTIKRGVGRGGFGEVYFAVSNAGKQVALKLIRRNLEVEIRGVTQCLNLKHQNLIALYDIRTDEHEDRWVVMEYVSGESLDDAIDRHPKGMPLELAMHWFEGIASGVAYLHDHGIVHRDLKPANLFMDENTVKIGDYGLSKFISCSRRSGQTESVGTVHYMAPEIGNGRYGKEIDTYALGIILYEMLTGHVPFEGESVGEVLMKHLTAEPDLSVLNEPYRSIVCSAMAKDPEERIKSVSEMLDRLPSSAKRAGALPMPNRQSAQAKPSVEAAANSAAPWPADQTVSADDTAASDEEPILAGLQAGWWRLQHEFRTSEVHPLAKALVGFFMVWALFVTVELWLPVGIVLACVYLVYRALWAIVAPSGKSLEAKKPQAEVATRQPAAMEGIQDSPNSANRRWGQHARRRRDSWQQQVQQQLARKPLRDRLTELCGSMIVAAVIAAIASLLVLLLAVHPFEMAVWVWMTLVATLASWAVMIPAKFAEGRVEDQTPLRFSLLVLGALVGVAAWGLAEGLMLSLPVFPNMGTHPGDGLMSNMLGWRGDYHSWDKEAIQLALPAYVAYFSFLFVLLGWWRQADFARRARVSVWSVAWCGLVAYLLHFFWWFPQPMGMLIAAIMAFTIQLSSPWMPPSRRRALSETGV